MVREMKKKMFVIPFRGLKEGEHQFEYLIIESDFDTNWLGKEKFY